jgi:hypothetical protein
MGALDEVLGQAGRGIGSKFGRRLLENILFCKGVNVVEYVESLGFFKIMRKREEREKKCYKEGERKGWERGGKSRKENDYSFFR